MGGTQSPGIGQVSGRTESVDYAIDPLVGSGDINAIIGDFEGWLHSRAWFLGGANSHDDLVQEGRIAMWHAVQTFRDDAGQLPHWLTFKANGRMVECVTRGTWTGQERRNLGATSAGIKKRREIEAFQARFRVETGREPTQQIIAQSLGMSMGSVSRYLNTPAVESNYLVPASLDEMLDSDLGFENLLEAADLTDQVMLAYHRGQILQALDALTPKQKRYVVLRFWCGYVTSELTQAFGYEPGSLWTSKTNGAREKLRSELAHLS